MVKIAPSILTADFTRLGEQIRAAEAGGADWIHLDIMDGQFVPNITYGPLLVRAVRSATDLPLDIHLMIVDPDRYLEDFAGAGGGNTGLTVHVETCPHLHRTVEHIHEVGCRAGVTLNPATPLITLEEILPYVDLVLVMSVNPGFGNQKFIPTSTPKIARLRAMIRAANAHAELEVDGGIHLDTAPEVVAAGATVLVTGSAVYNDQATVTENIAALRRSIETKREGGS